MQVVRREARRRLQFSLQAIIVVTAVCCTVAAIYGWRQRREEQLVRLVNQFNRELDNGDFQGALLTAEHTRRQFPAEPLAEFMLQKVQFVRSVSRGEHQPALHQY